MVFHTPFSIFAENALTDRLHLPGFPGGFDNNRVELILTFHLLTPLQEENITQYLLPITVVEYQLNAVPKAGHMSTLSPEQVLSCD